MEFEFRKDFITEQASVKTSMDHEAFSTWLEMEGQSCKWVDALLINIQKIQQRELSEYKLVGSEFTLQLTQEEASVINHRLLGDGDEDNTELESEEDLSFYNLEIEAVCGLEDFLNLIESWREFI